LGSGIRFELAGKKRKEENGKTSKRAERSVGRSRAGLYGVGHEGGPRKSEKRETMTPNEATLLLETSGVESDRKRGEDL